MFLFFKFFFLHSKQSQIIWETLPFLDLLFILQVLDFFSAHVKNGAHPYYEPSTSKHWVIKNPNHSTHLRSLLREFPKAHVIITHRDPNTVVASWGKMMLNSNFTQMHNDADARWGVEPRGLQRDEYGDRILHHMATSSRKLVHSRQEMREDPQFASKEKEFLDISFRKLMEDPIEVVKQIYSHFGYEFTKEYEESLLAYLKNNGAHKYGKPVYSLDELGLTKEQVGQEMAEYIREYKQYL